MNANKKRTAGAGPGAKGYDCGFFVFNFTRLSSQSTSISQRTGMAMKKYKDDRISFSYPEEFWIVRAKTKYGTYTLAKKDHTYITIDLVENDQVDSIKALIRSRPPDDIDDLAKIDYFESVPIGTKKGIGHVATMYERSHIFWGKIYRYLFPISTGGLYIEIGSRKDFTIDIYKSMLKSIAIE